ncbi:serine protein kinase RIO [Streptomyces griseiscabiei]|uniref:non-specific serine/threonine protein kinase n=1 Tax=Streptomyces griseiscabiei TaxID=2993540 RepID=A0ABU4LKN6_9ACTN|nr:RIO1 family regulatory kinase/ATPase [Streptomyces griseiscabiei]MBZ3900359.1 serine/threonine protein kinase [Streptomyces griseiscabiei]MDX2916309.1 lipopolysaccharide kinase InaA family protein [Streptomyces griseiscabiei]
MSHDHLSQHPQHPAFPDGFSTDAYRHVPPPGDIDDRFVFEFRTYDDLEDGRRWSTWHDVERLCQGPEPRPAWVVTSQGAVDTELGILKTGKEADVHLVERADPHDPAAGVVMAAKRYRSPERQTFHRSASYTEGRSMKRSRDERALKRKSTFGRQLAADEWAVSEWGALVRLWSLGLPVPYPVQIDGTEILMEWITVVDEDGTVATAPRLAQTRPSPELLESYFGQLTDALATMVQNGVVHGDLSAYNILAAGERVVVIDLPQIVDLVGNHNAMTFLQRDCANICDWFRSRGLDVDEHALFAELIAHAF